MKTVILIFGLFLVSMTTISAEEDPHTDDRKILRAILTDFETSLNEKKLGKMLTHLDDQAVMSFMTTEITIGKDAVQTYYDKMFKGDDAPLLEHKTKASLESNAIFHGNTIVAAGRTNDVFTLKNGSVYDFNTRWVATVIKKQGEWKVISVTFSVDPFKNIVIDELQNKIWSYAIMAFIAGLLIVFVTGWVRRR